MVRDPNPRAMVPSSAVMRFNENFMRVPNNRVATSVLLV
jgi:hypothetical protein